MHQSPHTSETRNPVPTQIGRLEIAVAVQCVQSFRSHVFRISLRTRASASTPSVSMYVSYRVLSQVLLRPFWVSTNSNATESGWNAGGGTRGMQEKKAHDSMACKVLHGFCDADKGGCAVMWPLGGATYVPFEQAYLIRLRLCP